MNDQNKVKALKRLQDKLTRITLAGKSDPELLAQIVALQAETGMVEDIQLDEDE